MTRPLSSGMFGEKDNLSLGPRIKRDPTVGKRRTSWRRRAAINLAIQAESLASAAGGNPIDRHKPYVYGTSSQRMRDNILKAYNASLEAGES
jgi:hypothetical protein